MAMLTLFITILVVVFLFWAMADETYADLGILDPVKNEGMIDLKRVVTRRTNGADIKPGHMVTSASETAPDVDLAVSGDGKFLGFAWKHAFQDDIPDNWDVDTAFADDTDILVIMPHDGNLEVFLHLAPKVTSGNQVAQGDTLVISAETGGDGQLDKAATDGSDNPSLVVGKVGFNESADPGETDADIILVEY